MAIVIGDDFVINEAIYFNFRGHSPRMDVWAKCVIGYIWLKQQNKDWVGLSFETEKPEL